MRALPDRLAQLAGQYLEQEQEAAYRREIEGLVAAQDAAALDDRLGCRLQFGTAGLRGPMGAGYSRMNAVTVRQATQGLVHYLQAQAPERLRRGGIAVGYDGRHHSREFAALVAAVGASQGVPVWLFSALVPTPFVPTAVQQLVR